MSLIFHYHPLSSFCWKVLIALYENGTAVRAPSSSISAIPTGARPSPPCGRSRRCRCSRTRRAARSFAETSIIIDYLDRHHPRAGSVRARGSRAGPRASGSGTGSTISTSRGRCRGSSSTGCGRRGRRTRSESPRRGRCWRPRSAWSRARWPSRRWATGEEFTLADCAAAPALFYADKVMPLARRLAERAGAARAAQGAAELRAGARGGRALFPIFPGWNDAPSPQRVAELTGVGEERLERLAGGELSEVLLVPRPDGARSVAKAGPAVGDRGGDAARAGRRRRAGAGGRGRA